MNLLRHLRSQCVSLDLPVTPREPLADETPAQQANRYAADKEATLLALAQLLDHSGEVVNVSKLHRDLVHRERKATTAIAPGIAIPHARTLQARSFIIAIARAPAPGLRFASLDGEPTRIFLCLASPPYDDRTYLHAYREFARLILEDDFAERLLAIDDVQAVFGLFRDFVAD